MKFRYIPEQEMNTEWFKVLIPIIKYCEKYSYVNQLSLIQKLNSSNWEDIKRIIERIFCVGNWQRVFDRKSEFVDALKTEEVIEAIFSEIQAAAYLDFKGFTNIKYTGKAKSSFDFTAELNQKTYMIEVKCRTAYHFKSQGDPIGYADLFYDDSLLINEAEDTACYKAPLYKLNGEKVIKRLSATYQEADKQRDNRGYDNQESIIIIVYKAIELEPLFFESDIQNFVNTCSTPTVILPMGYESSDRIPGKQFNRDEFVKYCYR